MPIAYCATKCRLPIAAEIRIFVGMHHLHSIDTLEDMRLTAREIVQHLDQYPIVLLKGNLGAGKTTLAQMICEILGVNEPVTSPTYTLVNEYMASGFHIYHFDLYRVEDAGELDGFGLNEYLDSGYICLVEWPEIARNHLAGLPCIEVTIHQENEKRTLELSYHTRYSSSDHTNTVTA